MLNMSVFQNVVNGIALLVVIAPVQVVQSQQKSKPLLAPVNEFQGMQEREEVFEFTQKPTVKKDGDKWIITFASKANCDATVTVLDKEGKVIRHLASGVLGKNAPLPFQQGSLVQKIEWDGLKDDFSKADTAGCKVRVSLGLQAKFERQMAYDPYFLNSLGLVAANGPDGSVYLFDTLRFQGRVFKDGKYVRTFWPPSAADIEKTDPLGYKLATTKWGDKVPVAGWMGPFTFLGDGRQKSPKELAAAMFKFAGLDNFDAGKRPQELLEPTLAQKTAGAVFGHYSRITLDPDLDLLYVSGLNNTVGDHCVRFNGKTGEWDAAWKGQPWTEVAFSPDGLIYGRFSGGGGGTSGHGRYMIRLDRSGKMVPFTENTLKEALPKEPFKDGFGGPPRGVAPGVLIMGNTGTGNVYQNGLQITANGQILAEAHSGVITEDFSDPKALRLALADSNQTPTAAKKLGIKLLGGGNPGDGQSYFVMLWDKNGKRITQNAVEGRGVGDGVYRDRDGNIYMVQGGVRPEGQGAFGKGKIDGITDVPIDYRRWGGRMSVQVPGARRQVSCWQVLRQDSLRR